MPGLLSPGCTGRRAEPALVLGHQVGDSPLGLELRSVAQRTQRAMASVAVARCAVKPSLKLSVQRSAVLVP